MPLRRGFKSDANWYARTIRAELGLQPHAPLCPLKLAAHLEYEVVPLSSYAVLAPDAVDYLRSPRGQNEFSAITLCVGPLRLIIHNDTHHPYRQTANITHELAHGLLNHEPVALRKSDGARAYDREQEDEANWLGPALLISDEAALHIAAGSDSHTVVQAVYRVSKDVLQMRLRVTGAAIRLARRQAA